MPEPKSALEELLAAVQDELPDCNCGSASAAKIWHSDDVIHEANCAFRLAGWAQVDAEHDLAALAPDMARAGQALAEALDWANFVLSDAEVNARFLAEKPHEGCDEDECPMCGIQAALATWRVLGEAEEGRDE